MFTHFLKSMHLKKSRTVRKYLFNENWALKYSANSQFRVHVCEFTCVHKCVVNQLIVKILFYEILIFILNFCLCEKFLIQQRKCKNIYFTIIQKYCGNSKKYNIKYLCLLAMHSYKQQQQQKKRTKDFFDVVC